MPDRARPTGTALRVVAVLLNLLALPALSPAAATAADPLSAVPFSPGSPVAGLSASCPGALSSTARRTDSVHCLVNRARAVARLPGFRRSGPLARAAGRHARDMARGRYFAHQRSGGPPLARRAQLAGWRGQVLGEAIAYGCNDSASPLSIVGSWLASPPHAAILLSRHLARAGIGSARAPMECPGATYVLVAGRG